MIEFRPSSIKIDSEIVGLIEEISRKQGEISAIKKEIQDELEIEAVSAVDAVHFSTKIEGNQLTRDQVTAALSSDKKLNLPIRELREVLNYSKTRRLTREWALKKKPFDDRWILQHHAELLNGIVTGKLRGHYREAQCVIKDSATNSIIYMAPEWRDVSLLMRGLLSWLRKECKIGTSSLLVAAQFHFEFVTIHPFMDGNGRLSRLLTNGILVAGAYDIERYASLEKQHEKNRSAYYKSLRDLQANNFYDIPSQQNINSWVKYWLKCLLATYEEGLHRLKTIGGNLDESSSHLLEDRLKKAEALFRRHLRLRASEYSDLVGMQRTQAVADLNKLVEAGILERVGGGRSTVYAIRKP